MKSFDFSRLGAFMAWNTPGDRRGNGTGGTGGGGPNVWDRLREQFGGGGSGNGMNPVKLGLILLGIAVLFNSFKLIDERQRGVVLLFGKFDRVMEPGANFKFPWPIETVTIVEATEITPVTGEMAVLTRDQNIVQISYNVQYQISDPQQYLFGSAKPRELLQQSAESAIREAVGNQDLDNILKTRATLADASLKQLKAAMSKYRTGLNVTQLGLPNARPPNDVKDAFDDVTRAQQDNEAKQNDARAYANQILPEARGQAARIKAEAEGYRAERIARAEGDAKRFGLLIGEYRKAPEVTRKRLYLETMQEVLSKNPKVMTGKGNNVLYLPLGGAQGGAPINPQNLAPTVPALPNSPLVPPDTRDNRPARGERADGREGGR